MCGIVQNTWHSGCTIAMVLLSVYGHFRQFWGGHTLGAVRLKSIISFAEVTSSKGTVMSYVMSQCCTCIGHMTFYYKRSADASVGGSRLLFIHLSGSTLSPETPMWLVPNACRSDMSSVSPGWSLLPLTVIIVLALVNSTVSPVGTFKYLNETQECHSTPC